MPHLIDGTELALLGPVAMEGGFDSADVIAALAEIGRDKAITVRLNSGGGLATEGAAIHAALSAHKGGVTVIVEGVAASAASLIAAAGGHCAMAPGAVMMIHDPSAVTVGTAADHTRSVAGLERLSAAYAGLYAERTGQSAEAMRDLMKTETWMTAEEAVAAGFADRVLGRDAANPAPTAFAYGLYAHAPAPIMAAAIHPAKPAPSPTASAPPGEPPGPAPSPPPADTQAESPGDAGAIAQLCAEAGEPSTLVAALLSEGATLATARARLADATAIRTRVAAARRVTAAIEDGFADDAIAKGLSPDAVSAALLARLTAAPGPAIDSSRPGTPDQSAASAAGPGAGPSSLNPRAIYDRMNGIGAASK
ncbi:head maturation protease, ClpP-related [Fodinicurvata sp. EGI_FJ10296]|uniref:head maturation protease, ClpP-related n=1 Tax=Fodinicurvata sp. EGI_FJ10296 TaxID=3231908 RepID=UPI0034524318